MAGASANSLPKKIAAKVCPSKAGEVVALSPPRAPIFLKICQVPNFQQVKDLKIWLGTV
jgi:hypothetical protein